ncbi:MAG: YerC/YecD family TrpR-related protein [bacterium]|nr:YerC/YecD family TrpR-related protein [bacterium]
MNLNNKEGRQLVNAILTLKTFDEAKRFLRDLMTEKEITEFTKRFTAAQMLAEKVPYSIIEKKTGLSSTTVARVSKWLNGKEGGYKKAIQKMHHHTFHPKKEGIVLMK